MGTSQNTAPDRFWQHLDQLLATCRLVIDRPKGSAHPRYPDLIYPLDYGYLEGTSSADRGGIDVWVGSLPQRVLTAVVCTVDLLKRDSEIKLLVGCSPDEMRQVVQVHNSGPQAAILIRRPEA